MDEISTTGWDFKCDCCGRVAHYPGQTLRLGRESAEGEGWQFLPNGKDFCPTCRIKPEQLVAPVQLRDSCGYPAKGGE